MELFTIFLGTRRVESICEKSNQWRGPCQNLPEKAEQKDEDGKDEAVIWEVFKKFAENSAVKGVEAGPSKCLAPKQTRF